MREQGGNAQAGVLGSDLRTNTISAAWTNGALAHLLDYDDTGFSHPTACILPAGLAMAEATGATGGALVEPFVSVWKFSSACPGRAGSMNTMRRRGFDPTCLLGVPRAALPATSLG